MFNISLSGLQAGFYDSPPRLPLDPSAGTPRSPASTSLNPSTVSRRSTTASSSTRYSTFSSARSSYSATATRFSQLPASPVANDYSLPASPEGPHGMKNEDESDNIEELLPQHTRATIRSPHLAHMSSMEEVLSCKLLSSFGQRIG